MTSPLDEDPSVEPVHEEGRLDDVNIQYMKSNIMSEGEKKENQMYTSTRLIEVTIIEERDNEIEARLEVTDNTNKGMDAMGSTRDNYWPKDQYEEFSEKKVFDKSNILYYQDNFPNIQSYMPIGERITPNVKEWSEKEPFRA